MFALTVKCWILFSVLKLLILDTPLDFSGGSDGKASVYNTGDLGLSPGLGRSPGEGKGYPLQYSGLENFGLCGPWGRKESDTTEQLHFHFGKI